GCVVRIKRRLRHLVLASVALGGVVALSACTGPQLLDNVGPLDGSPTGADAGDRWARSRSRSMWQDIAIAPGTDRRAAKSEFISRGTGQFVGDSDAIVTGKTFKGTDGVMINLLNAPIPQAAKTILGDILKTDYVISDKVSGTVTVQTSSPVEPAAVADIFAAVLKSNGV